jgi:esterase/lipase
MRKYWPIGIVLIVVVVYLLGPKPAPPTYSVYPNIYKGLQASQVAIATTAAEAAVPGIKPGNQARVIWANDTVRQKTKYSILYLPGFTATAEEGAPIHTNIAKKFGCNLYIARLAQHGLQSEDAFETLTAETYWKSALEALYAAEQLGDSVLIMSTSTGGTLSLLLCANNAINSKIAGNIMMSPNIEIFDSKATILNNPWGLQIARIIKSGNYIESTDQRDIFKKHWYSKFRLEGAIAVQELIETGMNQKNFAQITQPQLLLYYFKNEQQQDNVVSVPAMQKMFASLATPSNAKVEKAVPDAGDHVIGSYIKSKDLLTVQTSIEQFLMQKKYLIPLAQ